MSANAGASPSGEGGSSLLTCCTCVEAGLHGLACCCPALDDGILSSKVISTLSGGDAVWSHLVKGDRTSLFTMGVSGAVCRV
jgi:hypothetical protein